jgi:hypothetical protein
MKQSFSIKEAFSTGWEIFKEHWKFLLLLGLMIIGIEIITSLVSIIPFVGFIIQVIVDAVVVTGGTYILLALYDKKKPTYKDLFSQTRYLLPYFMIMLLSILIMFGGLMIFIIPGIIASIALMFPIQLMVDRGMSGREAVRTSWAISQDHLPKLFLFVLALLVFNMIGAIVVVGLIITIPVSMLASVHIYRKLLATAEADGKLPVAQLQTIPKVFIGVAIAGFVIGAMALGYFAQTEQGRALIHAIQTQIMKNSTNSFLPTDVTGENVDLTE